MSEFQIWNSHTRRLFAILRRTGLMVQMIIKAAGVTNGYKNQAVTSRVSLSTTWLGEFLLVDGMREIVVNNCGLL